MPRSSKRRNRSADLDPKDMSLAQLQTLPRQSLILLAAARNLVTTGTKTRIAYRIFAHEHHDAHAARNPAPRPSSPQVAGENPGSSSSLAIPAPLTVQQPSLPSISSSNSSFSSAQLNQLRDMIAKAVGSRRTDYSQLANLSPDVPPLSPASVSNSAQMAGSGQNPRAENQDGGTSHHQQLEPSPPTALHGTVALELPVSARQTQQDPSLPPLPEKLRTKIMKRDYVDFNDLLSDNMYPHPSYASSQDHFTLALKDATTLAFVPSQRKKRRIDGLSSWLEAWNVYSRTILSLFPQLAPDLLAYQDQMCKFSQKFKASAWLMYDTAFRYMAASNLSIAWGKVNEQLYNDILKEETLPYCIHCHSYGHRTLSCSTRSKPSQSYRSPMDDSPPPPLPDTSHLSATTSQPPSTQHQQPAAICRDFNRRSCRRPNCQFLHVCNKPDCGEAHPGAQCPKGTHA